MASGSTSSKRAIDSNAKNVVRSLAKGFRILEAFEPGQSEMTLSEIAARAHLDAGTTYRLINTLVLTRYLRPVPGTKRYRLGLKTLTLGFATIAAIDVVQVARPILRSLLDHFVQSVSLDILEEKDLIRVEHLRTIYNVKSEQPLGCRISLRSPTIGDAFVAYLPEAERRSIIHSHDSSRPRVQYALIRKLGYAHFDGTQAAGNHIIAAPTLDVEGYPRAVLSATCPSAVCSEQKFIRHILQGLRKASAALGRVFAASGSRGKFLGANAKAGLK